MTFLNNYKWFFRLIRVPNLVIIAMTMALVLWFILMPVFPLIAIHHSLYLCILITYTLLIAAGGYIYNDMEDLQIDLINKPEKTVISVFVSAPKAMKLYVGLTAAGILCSMFFSFLLKTIYPVIIAAAAAGLLFGYAKTWKKQFLTGNLIVAFLCMITVLQPCFYLLSPSTREVLISFSDRQWMALTELVSYAILAFIATLFREIAKDVQDIEGDRQHGCRTVPVAWGIANTKWLLYFVAASALGVSCFLLYQQWEIKNDDFILFFLVFNLLPFFYSLFKIALAKEASDFKIINYLALYNIVSGTLSIIFYKI